MKAGLYLASAFRSSRFDGSDSLGGLVENAVALFRSDNRARREYRRLRRDRTVPAAGRRRTPGDNSGPHRENNLDGRHPFLEAAGSRLDSTSHRAR